MQLISIGLYMLVQVSTNMLCIALPQHYQQLPPFVYFMVVSNDKTHIGYFFTVNHAPLLK